MGNLGVDYWNDGAYERAKNGVVGISSLEYAQYDEQALKIAKKAVEKLLKNNNVIFLLPRFNEEELVTFCEEFFPQDEKILL